MWLLFHHRSGTKVVADGQTFVERCPTCEKPTRFREVETTDSYGVWFVDVTDDHARGFRCSVCGDVFDLRDQEPVSARRPAPKMEVPPVVDRTEQLAAEQRRREAERAAKDIRIDDELAELKRRIGR